MTDCLIAWCFVKLILADEHIVDLYYYWYFENVRGCTVYAFMYEFIMKLLKRL